MTCYRPINATSLAERRPNGKRRLDFKHPPRPNTADEWIQVPCRQCIGCKLDKSIDWAIRITNEAQKYRHNQFITLTYSDQHVPHNGSLRKKDWKNFRELMDYHFKRHVRYYMCGEYGQQFELIGDQKIPIPGSIGRPHFHAVLFDTRFPDTQIHSVNNGIPQWWSPTLDRFWQHKGIAVTSDLSFDAAAYIARYVTKKITGPDAEDHYTRPCPTTGNPVRIQEEYAQMSTKPGLGSDWFMEYSSDIYNYDYAVMNGKKFKAPEYYDTLLERYSPDYFKEIKEERQRKAKLNWKENTPQRLRAREEYKTYHFNQLQRKL